MALAVQFTYAVRISFVSVAARQRTHFIIGQGDSIETRLIDTFVEDKRSLVARWMKTADIIHVLRLQIQDQVAFPHDAVGTKSVKCMDRSERAIQTIVNGIRLDIGICQRSGLDVRDFGGVEHQLVFISSARRMADLTIVISDFSATPKKQPLFSRKEQEVIWNLRNLHLAPWEVNLDSSSGINDESSAKRPRRDNRASSSVEKAVKGEQYTQTDTHIDQVLDQRLNNNQVQYKVKWDGYHPRFNTWSSRDDFEECEGCLDKIDEFDEVN